MAINVTFQTGLTPRGRHRVSVRPKVPGPPPNAQERQKLTSFLHFSTPAGGKCFISTYRFSECFGFFSV